MVSSVYRLSQCQCPKRDIGNPLPCIPSAFMVQASNKRRLHVLGIVLPPAPWHFWLRKRLFQSYACFFHLCVICENIYCNLRTSFMACRSDPLALVSKAAVNAYSLDCGISASQTAVQSRQSQLHRRRELPTYLRGRAHVERRYGASSLTDRSSHTPTPTLSPTQGTYMSDKLRG